MCRSPVNTGKSLRQIQEEEALRLEKEKKEQQKSAVNVPAAGTWGSNKPVAVTGWASEGAWGNAVRKGTWDQPNTKPAKTSNR